MSNTNGEQLRELCSLGDVTKVQILINSGVNVNSQNPVNGWTALHWAVKRNHCDVIKLLLASGANKETLNKDGKSPGELTTNPDVLALLGHNVIIEEAVQQESKTTFVPNYLANPPFIYSQQQQQQQPNKQQELPEVPPPPAQSNKGTGFWYQPREMFALLKDLHKPCGLIVHPEYMVLRALGWANNVELQFKRSNPPSLEELKKAYVEKCGRPQDTQVDAVFKLPNNMELTTDSDVLRLTDYQEIRFTVKPR
ncbi:uncharacterized protein LOC100187163 isoform X2 [Ciona intestinalis]